jgi:predicted DNA-binding mobile mystery protein A
MNNMANQKQLILDQLDQKIQPFHGTELLISPQNGWINCIRTSLNMTLEQLGNKLGITKQGVRSIEENESNQSITIKSLSDAGHALNLKLVYALIPQDKTFNQLVEQRAYELASKIVQRTNQNMNLEDQANSTKRLKKATLEMAAQFKREMDRSLWD